MSGEVWQTPKTNWGVEAIPTTYYNKVEGNDVVMHKGNGHTTLVGVAANASGELDINSTDESFEISDATNPIGLILTVDRQPGNKIFLMARNGAQEIVPMETPSGNYKAIKIYGGASTYTLPEDGIMMFQLGNDGYWHLGILTA